MSSFRYNPSATLISLRPMSSKMCYLSPRTTVTHVSGLYSTPRGWASTPPTTPDLLSTANDPDGDDEAENAFAGADRDADGVSDYQFFQRDDGTMGQHWRTDEHLEVRVRAWVDGVSPRPDSGQPALVVPHGCSPGGSAPPGYHPADLR